MPLFGEAWAKSVTSKARTSRSNTVGHRVNNDQLPGLVAELVRKRVSVIVILESTHGALSAKAATGTIPIVFMQGADPVRIGLVSSLNRPNTNLTGINLFLSEVIAKRLELLLDLAPAARSIGYLHNPTNPVFAETETKS